MSAGPGPIELFGTAEPAPERRPLRAGRLTAILEEGNLRDICFGGVEIVRAVNYLARDAAWGTYRAELTGLDITETEAFFDISYDGLCGGGNGFSYRMHIRGEADGRLILEADGVALADFDTNRTGFVVLHPASAAGGRLTVRHSDGSEEATAFPDAIRADQPAFDIAALTHEPAPGLLCTVAMAGDAFEMEDQRNWADASFKTYVRPLARPRPYRIAKGDHDRQRIAIEIRGTAGAAPPLASGVIDMTLGPRGGPMPEMGLFIADAADFAAAPSPSPLPMQKLVVRIDPLRPDPDRLARIGALAAASGASIAAELILDTSDPEREAQTALGLLAATRLEPAALLVSPRREFTSRASRTLPPGEQPVAASVEALRRAGFAGPIGAGTPSYFTEFNRNPPGPGADLVFFSVAATVHAADDISVMETLEVYPQLVASARRLCPGAPIWLGPCTIGVRHNPYGADVQPNPDGRRIPSARLDPRQGALFGAAFAAGAAARAAEAEVALLLLAAPGGPFGLLGEDGRRRPIHAVQAELANAAGAERQSLYFSRPGLAGLAYWTASGLRALVANLTPAPLECRLPAPLGTAWRIEADGGLATMRVEAGRLVLPPYRTAILAA